VSIAKYLPAFPTTQTLKMEATNFFETSVVMSRWTWRHIADDLDLRLWKFHIFITKFHTHHCELFWWPHVKHTRVGTLIVATIYLQLIQN